MMKAISVKEPWAGMIASGKKTIETRTWKTKYRGEILIVASLKPKTENSGKAIAIAKIWDCRDMVPRDRLAACCQIYDRAKSWVLADIRRIKPFKVRGKLSVYSVDIDKADIEYLGE